MITFAKIAPIVIAINRHTRQDMSVDVLLR